MQINLIWDSSVNAAPAGFEPAIVTAANAIDALITNPITVNIQVGWGEIGGTPFTAPIAGQTEGEGGTATSKVLSYAQVRGNLTANATSTAALTAAANLPASDPTGGAGLLVSGAQEKAWGLLPATGSEIDGEIGFAISSGYSFDLANAPTTDGDLQMVGAAEHELTHALGRIAAFESNSKTIYNVLDLYRYSAPGVLQSVVNSPAYFSIDGGRTNLDNFSTVDDDGDWDGSSGPDAFNAHQIRGQVNGITSVDITEMNVLGFAISGGTAGGTGLIGNLTVNQQLELIYIGYFDRSADGSGFNFWVGQDTQAQGSGQTAVTALTNIADSFTPQPETIGLYPFLASAGANLTTPSAHAGLVTFIAAVYQNLFGHAPDAAGASYWLNQISSGAAPLGAAILAIANGATGNDATELVNKVTVALDFTTRTNAAGLTGMGSSSTSLLAAAHSVLSGVDGTSLNDASVTAGENATAAFISGAKSANGGALALTADTPAPGAANDLITISASNSVVDPGLGNYAIQFLAGSSSDTLVPHSGGVYLVSGFDPSTDVLDLRSLLSEANVNPGGGVASLNNYLTVTDQGSNALIGFDPTGHGGGNSFIVLQGPGAVVTNLDTLVAEGAIRIA